MYKELAQKQVIYFLFRLFFVFFILPLISYGQNYEKYDITMMLSAEQAKSDLNYLVEKLESVHPDLYAYTSKQTINKEKDKILREFNRSISRIEFAKKTIPLIAMLNDGHTFMIFPYEEEEVYSIANGTYFPFDMVINDKKLFISRSYLTDKTILPGWEILSVNGIQTKSLLQTMKRFVSGETEHYRLQSAARNFRRFLWILFGMESNFTIEFASENGQLVKKTVPGSTASTIIEQRKQIGSTQNSQNPPFFYSSFQEKGFGILTINTLDGNLFENFKQFLHKSFEQIKQEKLENLVIDIRRNGGGDTRLVVALFNYLTKKPYSLYEKVEFKISPEVEREPRFADFLKSDEFKNKRKDNFVYWEANLRNPENNNFLFKGKIFLLTGQQTFSSASDQAAVFKCYRMGLIVGEETGGVGVSFGELIAVTLPNSKLIANVSSKKFVQPCANNKLEGITPDFEVKQTMADLQKGIIDTVLEFVKKRIGG